MKRIFLLGCCCAVVLFATAQTKTVSERQAIINTVKGFYQWYKNQAADLDKYPLYRGKKKENPDGPPYMIDWKNVEKHFAWIRKNVPWLGETFIENERKFFKESEKYFNENPEEEMPVGFDYDRIIGGQDTPVWMLPKKPLEKNINWKVNIEGKKAIVEFTFTFKNYEGKMEKGTEQLEMVKEKGVWKIALPIGMMPFEVEGETEASQQGGNGQ
jgi:hypothetical protein